MTKEEFASLKIGDRVKANYTAKPRNVAYVYDDPSGARVVSLSAIQGCTKSITNLSYGAPDHYVNWRLSTVKAQDAAKQESYEDRELRREEENEDDWQDDLRVERAQKKNPRRYGLPLRRKATDASLPTNLLALFGLYAIWKALSAPSRFSMPAGSGYKAAMELEGQGWDRSKK